MIALLLTSSCLGSPLLPPLGPLVSLLQEDGMMADMAMDAAAGAAGGAMGAADMTAMGERQLQQ